MEDFVVEKKLAQGGQGSTMLVRRKVPTPEQNTTMVLKQSKCENLKAANNALKEAKTLQRLQHANIVCYIDVFLHEEDKFLIICTLMEYCDRGDLGCYMNRVRAENNRISERGVLRWTREMMTALDYLHQQHIIHRDIKPLNVFLTADGHVKLGDFGLASSSKNDKTLSQVGTPCYLSPEVLQNEDYSEGVDVWGVGCIVFEMMTLDFLWERKGMLSVQVLSRPISPFDFPQDYSQALRDLAVSMLDKNPSLRPSPARVAKACALLKAGGSSSRLLQPAASPLAGFHDLAQGLAGHVDALFRPQPQSPSSNPTPAGPPPAPLSPDQRAPPRVPGAEGGGAAGFRRQTPAQAAGRPQAANGAGGGGAGRGPGGGHGGGEKGAVEGGSSAGASPNVGGRKGGAEGAAAREERFMQQKAVREMLEVRGLRRYVGVFEAHELYGEELGTVTETDLEQDMGVANAAHRFAILKAIRDILNGVPPTQVPPPPAAPPPARRAAPAEGPRSGGGADHEGQDGGGGGAERRRASNSAHGRGREGSFGKGSSEAGRWLREAGFGDYQQCFEANGVRKLQELSALSRPQLEAMGIPGTAGPAGVSVVAALAEALRGLRARQGRSAAEEEEDMVQRAIQESLVEYESSISSSPAPSNPATGSQPGSWAPGGGAGSQPGSRQSGGAGAPSPGSGSTAGSRARRETERRERERRESEKGERGGAGAELVVLQGMVSVGSIDGRGWRMAFCRLENNRLRVWWGDAAPEGGAMPDEEVVMDGMCVDVAEGREGCVFVRRSMHVKTDGDRLLAMRNLEQFTQWLQRLQASAYFKLVPGASSVHSRVKGIVVQTVEIVNASALFKEMSLVVNVARASGEWLYTVKEFSLPPPAEKARMRFELWVELPVPAEDDAAMFFEVRHVKAARQGPVTKYWATLPCADMQQGSRTLTVYKAPCEYCAARQRLQPKQSSRLDVTLTA